LGRDWNPVNFGGWLQDSPPDPGDLEFWLRYWTAAYQFISDHADESTVLVSYARLTEEPEQSLSRLADVLGLPADELTPLGPELCPPQNHSTDEERLPDPLLREARKTYRRLGDRATVWARVSCESLLDFI
jgi:hypothetical protein